MLTALLVTALAAGAVSAAPLAPERAEYGFSGEVGRFPIAMVVSVRNESDLVSAHYSYASQQKIIPLQPKMNGATILLAEPGGGAFDLHLTTSANTNDKPLTFYTSTGLAGTWTDGKRRLPVRLTLMSGGSDSAPIKDCSLYPTPAPPKGPHFPNPGCEHTPDQATLDECISKSFTTDAATTECIDRSVRPCQSDQYDVNICAGNVESYLGQIVKQRLGPDGGSGRVGVGNYRRWASGATSGCVKTSPFSPDGSGYGADIATCMAAEELRLLQKGLTASPRPVRSEERH